MDKQDEWVWFLIMSGDGMQATFMYKPITMERRCGDSKNHIITDTLSMNHQLHETHIMFLETRGLSLQHTKGLCTNKIHLFSGLVKLMRILE
jgi:hypothetical protein